MSSSCQPLVLPLLVDAGEWLRRVVSVAGKKWNSLTFTKWAMPRGFGGAVVLPAGEPTDMTISELILELQRLHRRDPVVYIPSPHCCGQSGTDFDLLDAEFLQTMERHGREVAVLGDPERYCLIEKRMDSRCGVRRAVVHEASAVAQYLGLNGVGTVSWDRFSQMARQPEADDAWPREFRDLRQPDLVIEATDGIQAHFIVVETPFLAVPDNVRRAARTAGVLARLSGNPSQAVVACVKRDTSLDREELPAG